MTHYSPIKEWLLRWLEPYREERASHLLAWRIFAQKHNAAGKMPKCAWKGMDEKGYELDPKEKVHMYEFPPDSPQAEPFDPDCLVNALEKDRNEQRKMRSRAKPRAWEWYPIKGRRRHAAEDEKDEARLKLEQAKDRLG